MATQQISVEQLEANRLNAQKSTGPTSDEGKAVSSRNSTTHGLSGRVDLQTSEARLAYAEKGKRLIADWKPIGEQEEDLVCMILDAAWQMNRAKALEEKLWKEAESNQPAQNPKLTIEKAERYQAHHSRIYFRAVAQLVKLQKIRREAEMKDLLCALQREHRMPYNPRRHGLVTPPDGFVLQQSTSYEFFESLAAASKAEIGAKSVVAAAAPVTRTA